VHQTVYSSDTLRALPLHDPEALQHIALGEYRISLGISLGISALTHPATSAYGHRTAGVMHT